MAIAFGAIYAAAVLAVLAVPTSLAIDRPAVQMWLGVAGGNWSAPSTGSVDPFWVALAGLVGVVLNNGLIFLAGGAFWAIVVRDRTRVMKLSEALLFKDVAVKQALYAALADDEETIRRIEDAFARGNRDWRDYLAAVFSEGEADRLLEHVKNAEVSG